jgi:hypothetical protein
MSLRSLLLAILLSLAAAAFAADPDVPPSGPVMSFDLSKPFGLPPGWRFAATQAPPVRDYGYLEPGRITLCIRRHDEPCVPALQTGPNPDLEPELHGFHYLEDARIVYPRGPRGRPLLLVRAASLMAFNGDADVMTQIISYDPRAHGFRRVYRFMTRRNRNEEVRYVGAGPLKGYVISAEPQERLPYGYWITVNVLTPAYTYRQVLHYPSATRYGDLNPLAVIDSEMPNFLQRLGLWRPGMPLPVPARCRRPHLVRTELWCN